MGRRTTFWMLALPALAGCSDPPPPPEKPLTPVATFEGLPLSGNKETALAAGFGQCKDAPKGMRCRKDGVMIKGAGPYSAAVDLDITGPNGRARFDRVTLWHDSDQGALLAVKAALETIGWTSCLTPDAERYWQPPSPLRIAIDTSYWGKRRMVISAPPPDPKPYC